VSSVIGGEFASLCSIPRNLECRESSTLNLMCVSVGTAECRNLSTLNPFMPLKIQPHFRKSLTNDLKTLLKNNNTHADAKTASDIKVEHAAEKPAAEEHATIQ
jgi:hypothetical protein